MCGSCKETGKIYLQLSTFQNSLWHSRLREWARHVPQVGVEDTCAIWTRSEKMRKWEVQVLFWVKKWESEISYSRARNVWDIMVLVLSHFCLVDWICLSPFFFPYADEVNSHSPSCFLSFPPLFPFSLPFWEDFYIHEMKWIVPSNWWLAAPVIYVSEDSRSSVWGQKDQSGALEMDWGVSASQVRT